jgi:hypothetical protein
VSQGLQIGGTSVFIRPVTAMSGLSIIRRFNLAVHRFAAARQVNIRDDVRHRAVADARLRGSRHRLQPRRQRPQLDAGRARFDLADAVEGSVDRHYHAVADLGQGGQLFHPAYTNRDAQGVSITATYMLTQPSQIATAFSQIGTEIAKLRVAR